MCGGISVFIHDAIKHSCQLIKRTENIVWLELNMKRGKALTIGLVYFPPEGSSQLSTSNDLFTQLEIELADLSNTHETIVIGDFNAHTGNAIDFSINAEGTDIPPEILGSDLVMNLNASEDFDTYLKQRNSQDNRPVNIYGTQLLDLCMDTNHLILNGCLEVDAEGCHTRIENGNKSVLDYAICSVAYLLYIKDFKVCNFTLDSDHCGI